MTNVLVQDLDLNLHDHVDARRFEIVRMASHCLAERSLQLTQRWCQRSVKRARQNLDPLYGTEWS